MLGALVLGAVVGYGIRFFIAQKSAHSLEEQSKKELEEARTEAKSIVVEAKEKATTVIENAQREERERKQEIRQLEERLLKKEDAVEKDRAGLEQESERVKKEETRVHDLEVEAKKIKDHAVTELERVAQLSREDAKRQLFKELEESNKKEMNEALIKFERERKDALDGKALEVIISSLERCARDHINDVTTSVVELPNEEIKGKIIGREGRNIKTFERLTGVEVIVDETPESILLSSFDPYRRELAKMSLERLIKDGRIQPAKIEEKVEEARAELEKRIQTLGEEAAYECGIMDFPKEILAILGRLHFRTSYGQNVLQHSIEMAHIAGAIASELGLNVAVVKKGALVHDLGKAIDHDVEGTHVEIGRKLLKKYGVDEAVIHAMESHHNEFPYSTPEAYVVTTADVISGARPGARRDTVEKYIKRLEEIERVVNGFEGVKQSYAVSAGREVRVFVVPEKIDDFGALQLAKEIAGKIQSDVQYPGEIKVTVVREVKAVEYAR